jgi:hypothetical protein
MFDITQKRVAEKARLELTDANEAPLLGEGGKQCAVVVHGPGSPVYARAEAKKNNKVMDRLKKKGKTDTSAEEARAQQADFLADITESFEGFGYPSPDDPDKPLEGRALFRAVYMDLGIGYIADQVTKFVSDWENFTPKSAGN